MPPRAAHEHKLIHICEMMERLGIDPGGGAAPEPKLPDRFSPMP
jgi:hypothetical protein